MGEEGDFILKQIPVHSHSHKHQDVCPGGKVSVQAPRHVSYVAWPRFLETKAEDKVCWQRVLEMYPAWLCMCWF